MEHTTVFFDWGGVIANDPGDEFLGNLLAKIGATVEQQREIFKTYMKRFMKGEISEREYWQLLRDNYGLTIHDSISEEFRQWKGLVANQDVLGLVSELHTKGMKVAVFSNVIEPTYNVIKQAGYYDLFDDVIASCKVGLVKPEPEIYQLALEQTGAEAKESIFIDDKQSCLDPASRMGFATVLAQDPAQIIRDVRNLAGI